MQVSRVLGLELHSKRARLNASSYKGCFFACFFLLTQISTHPSVDNIVGTVGHVPQARVAQ